MDKCIQKENIGSLKKAAEDLTKSVERLDKRINGTFDRIGVHIEESPVHRGDIKLNAQSIKRLESDISEIKKSYWKAAVITALITGILIKIVPLDTMIEYLIKLVRVVL